MITDGLCQVPSRRNIKDVLNETPKGHLAMFAVVSIPSTVEDHILGESVYIHNGRVYDFMCDVEIEDLQAGDLRFLRYVERN
jgi:hypothetical protein